MAKRPTWPKRAAALSALSPAAIVSALIGFALMTAYWPGLAGLKTMPTWIVGGCIVAAFFFVDRVRLTPAHIAGLTLIGLLLLTMAWAPSLDGIDAALCLVIIAVAFGFGSTLDDVRPLVIGAAFGLAVSSVVICAETVHWITLENFDGPAALFYNRNRLAEVTALVVVALAALRLWWFIPMLLPALLLPEARGALIAAIVPLLILAYRRERWNALLRALIMMVAFAALLGFVLHRGLDTSANERIALWRDTIAALNWQGHGLGSFWDTFPAYAQHFVFAQTHSRPEHPHNEFLNLAYEGGAVAVVLALVFVYTLWRAAAFPMALVLLALGIVSMVAMPFHDPATVLFGAVVAGYCVGRRDAVSVAAHVRGNSLQPRLAAGAVSRGTA